jgi:hypothetical protein
MNPVGGLLPAPFHRPDGRFHRGERPWPAVLGELGAPPRPLRLRRLALLRVILRPRAACLLLEGLAYHADINRLAALGVIHACALHHVPRD